MDFLKHDWTELICLSKKTGDILDCEIAKVHGINVKCLFLGAKRPTPCFWQLEDLNIYNETCELHNC